MPHIYARNTEEYMTIVCTFMNARQLTLRVPDETTVGSLLSLLSVSLDIEQGKLKLFHHTTPLHEGMLVEETTLKDGVRLISCVMINESHSTLLGHQETRSERPQPHSPS